MTSDLAAKSKLVYKNNSFFVWFMATISFISVFYAWYFIIHPPTLPKQPPYKCLQWGADVGTSMEPGPSCITWLDLKTHKVTYMIGN